MVSPTPQLNPESMPWARSVDDRIASLRTDADRVIQNSGNNNKQLNASITVLAESVRNGIGSLYTKPEIDALFGGVNASLAGKAPISHTHDQSQISGTWDKPVNTTGFGQFDAGLNSINVRNFNVGADRVTVWVDSTGRIGNTASSIKVKQDFKPADTDAIVQALYSIGLVDFRYIVDVERLGENAHWELGGIAEYFEQTDLGRFVFRDANGDAQGINYEKLITPLIAVIQDLNCRLKELESD